jgi:heme/copper-type cytochrome/quinol oxidase subunit 2
VAKDQEIGVVRVWYGNTCLAQQTLRSASAVEVEKKSATDENESADDSEGLWNRILTIALGVAAVLFVLVLVVRARAAAKRRRRRRKKTAARKTTRTAPKGRRSR